MTQLIFATAELEKTLSAVDTQLVVLTEILKDKSFPLDDRWELYLKAEKLLPIDKYLPQSVDVLTDCAYDDIFPAGRGFKYNSDIDETLVESGEWALEQKREAAEAGIDYVPETYEEHALEQYAKRDEWREAVLAEGVGGFPFDW